MSKVWVFRDAVAEAFEICEEYTDAVGDEFVEVDLPDEFVRAFARTQLAYYQYQDYLERAWVSGKKKEEK
jgi:hypothetical protein